MSYSIVKAALESHLQVLANAELVDVAWANEDYKPVNDVYFQPFILPFETNTVGLAVTDSNDFGGIFQVNVNFKKDTGTNAAREAVDSLLTHFYKATKLNDNVFIEQSYAVAQLQKIEGWFTIPVSIRYRLFA